MGCLLLILNCIDDFCEIFQIYLRVELIDMLCFGLLFSYKYEGTIYGLGMIGKSALD